MVTTRIHVFTLLLALVSVVALAEPPDKPASNLSATATKVSTPTSTTRPRPKAGDQPLSILNSDARNIGGTFMIVGWTPSAEVGAFVFLSEEEIEVGYDESGDLQTNGDAFYKTYRQADETPEVAFTNLNPNKKYFYSILPMLDPELGNGQVIPHYRTAKTLNRAVHIKATKIHLIDDSDDLSDGEVAFSFQLLPPDVHPKYAEPSELHDAARWPELSGNEGAGEGYVPLCSGATTNPSVDLFAFGVGDHIRYAVSGYDDDVTGVYDVAPLPLATQYTGAFNVDHGEANSVFWTLDIDGGTFETDTEDPDDFLHMEEFEYNWVAKAPENDTTCLEFEVHFTVSVTYFAD